ncbi:hypothetical protein [Desulfofundulus thermocisternus]|uniref:hypothetical protein n=1 Tax=Desulfofundulus thermocisternus TaxID=42471 RepID=UPI001A059982|nr:hypothetical protein [Desulfofundulus thermocisternus]MBE3584565.1 hypothetical protein [Thermoanaerobacter sp.]MCS5696620.1 hypothetical protein [Desulfofundulus thermocisternus]
MATGKCFSPVAFVLPEQSASSGSGALQELYRCAGTRFDPRVVEVFCRQAARDGVECSLRQPDLRALTITLSPEKAGSKGRDLKG